MDGTERVPRFTPPPAGSPTEFSLRVSIVGADATSRPERFVFDQPRVRVGRAFDVDLRIEHACVARTQFAIERQAGAAGEARFRIVPQEGATNPTYLNFAPAVEGTLKPGDVIGVGEVRVVLEASGRREGKEAAAAKEQISPLRMVLLALVVVMASVVAWSFLGGDDEAAGDVAAAQTPLFGKMPQPHCANPVECDAKAHESYDRAKKLMLSASADPGNRYRAVLEYARAKSYRDQSHRPLGDIADVDVREDNARKEAESAFDDARFQLKRAMASNDVRKQVDAAALLVRMVPDDNHPYRIKLDAYRRTLPKGQLPAARPSEEAK